MQAGEADDELYSQAGDDVLVASGKIGGKLYGGEGDDHLYSGRGDNLLDGGQGYDYY